jgi:hypothetical protein
LNAYRPVILIEDLVGTNQKAHAAPHAFLHIQVQGNNVFEID